MPLRVPRTQLLTNYLIPQSELLCKVRIAIDSGICCVQYRSPRTEDCFEQARMFAELCSSTNTQFIVNDHVDVASVLNQRGFQAGVWLGQRDMSVLEARKILGNDVFIGLSVNCCEEAKQANTLPINAIAANGVFECVSNPHAQTMGIEGLMNIISLSNHPVIAIGGIAEHNLQAILETGVDGVAISGAILRAADIENTTKCIVELCGIISESLCQKQ